MKSRFAGLAAASLLALVLPARGWALEAPGAERIGADQIQLRWQGNDPVDVYAATRPDAPIGEARLLTKGDITGGYAAIDADPMRPYFILKDERDGSVARTAERLLPLQQSSNFRDIGGYPAADGKHVRWGLIYRTAATPKLTDADYRYIRQLGVTATVDLRSTEERQVIPDQFPARLGVRYYATDYPASTIFSRFVPPASGQAPPPVSATMSFYRTWLVSLAPQFRDLFQQLLRHDGAVSYHCSAGQDRTGVATALILSALGVPRDVILQDYQLSTADRRPEYEMVAIDPAQYPGNIYASFMAKATASGQLAKPRPLYDEHGAILLQTFDEIDTRWGSVDNYLGQELGVTKADIARLRAIYLE